MVSVRALEPGGVSRETAKRLENFAALFETWSSRINLAAPSTSPELWSRHIADSAQLLELRPDARHWVDLGSGGGFPGLVIAILLSDSTEARVDLIESNRRKAAFLQTVRARCAPVARVHPVRIEDAIPSIPAPQIVTARALAPLPRLLALAEPWLTGSTVALFHKGRGYAAEVKESRAGWAFDLIEHRSKVAADSVILEIANLRALR
ncbi:MULTISPECIES: 16S rRNA (guanine(527)-N(7))-methyltransferase RsmG [unclassified Roseitalea]|uniref:16S rRNA (guanine(527)-N(7))-methyltransferase RsmG n=1 Tax=unclassified Roseitalea TaxID=2639107 RepID=UPI0027401447|nr:MULTISPECIES: 16S rRNA (guanine(527)-N(7))-methyltransferase RsmG [unclassified Roseitalea]